MSHFYHITHLQRISYLAVVFFCTMISLPMKAQNVDFENIAKAKPLVVSGD
jgi:TolB-like protein